AVATAASISHCCVTSPRQKVAMPPLPLRASTAAAPSCAFRPITHTREPSVVKTPAIPLPMPFVPPVTMTDLFVSDVSMGFPLSSRPPPETRLVFRPTVCSFLVCDNPRGQLASGRTQELQSELLAAGIPL